MKPSSLPSSPSSSSASSTSEPSDNNHQSPSSSSPPTSLSLRSPQLQAEFLKECRSRFKSHDDSSVTASSDSPLPSPFSPRSPSSPWSSASSSPSPNSRQARLSLSSPEILSELRQTKRNSLRQVPVRASLTTVFSGRGRGGLIQVSDSNTNNKPANPKTAR